MTYQSRAIFDPEVYSESAGVGESIEMQRSIEVDTSTTVIDSDMNSGEEEEIGTEDCDLSQNYDED